MKRLMVTATVAVLVAGCASCGSSTEPGSAPVPTTAQSEPTSTPAPSTSTSSSAPSRVLPSKPPACPSVVDGMSARERVAQLLVVGVEPPTRSVATTLARAQVGGIFIGGTETGLFTGNALAEVQRAAKVPLEVAVDDEGGRVQRIDELDGDLPSARELAATKSPEEVRTIAEQRGRALRGHGVTVDYAPDLDLTDEPADAAIGDRSFSADPAVARTYARAFAQGLEAAGVRPVIKHFPGHGSASGDSHTGNVTTPPLARLRAHDLVPYQRIGEYGDVSVMVGHLTVPGLTGGEPASVSPAAYRLLRTEFAFDGPVVTDDVGAMAAITDRYSLPDAVLRALTAGADQVLWSSGGDVRPVLDRLERAVRDGELPDRRVTEALSRVLLAKNACSA